MNLGDLKIGMVLYPNPSYWGKNTIVKHFTIIDITPLYFHGRYNDQALIYSLYTEVDLNEKFVDVRIIEFNKDLDNLEIIKNKNIASVGVDHIDSVNKSKEEFKNLGLKMEFAPIKIDLRYFPILFHQPMLTSPLDN